VKLVNEAVLVVRLSAGAVPPVQFVPVENVVLLVELHAMAVCAFDSTTQQKENSKSKSKKQRLHAI